MSNDEVDNPPWEEAADLATPDIIEAILDGREPDGMSLEQLRRPMSMVWGVQLRLFGTEGSVLLG